MNDLVLLERVGAIATLTLNRAERHNSLVPEFLREILDALDAIKQSDARVAILQANGRSSSTGGDVRAFYDHRDDIQAYSNEIVGLLNRVIGAMIALPIPIVGAVHGIVTGGSLGLVLACDVVLLAPHASFTPYYSVVGFSPDGGWTAMLPMLIGAKRAASVLMRNETITADQAVAWGIANVIVPGEKIRDEARAIANDLAAKKPGSIARTKKLLWRDVSAGLEAERHEFVEHIVTPEAQQGMAEFLRTEKPVFSKKTGFSVGQRATTTRTFTANDLQEFRALAGVMTDDTIPGPLLGGMFSFLLGTELPGRGTNYLKQTLRFSAPARVGETITATVEIARLRPDKDLVNLKTTCVNARGEIVCEGEALVLVKDVA